MSPLRTHAARSAALALSLGLLCAGASARAAAPSGAPRESTRLSIAALELDDRGAGAETAANLGALIATELARFSVFRVVTSEDVKKMISVEERKQLMGCSDTTCIAEIAGALGVEWIVSGSVGKVGNTYVLNLQLINQHQARVEAREDAKGEGPGALVDALRSTVRKLVRPLLKVNEGSLVVQSNEEGATVRVDDRVIGVTPLRRTPINWGPHEVLVQKDGFIAWAKEVEVESGEAKVLDVVLIPSAEFIAKYESRNKTLRYTSYAAFGAAAAAGGVAAYFWVRSGDRKDEQDRLLANLCAEGRPACPAMRNGDGSFVAPPQADKLLVAAAERAGRDAEDDVTRTNIFALAVATPLALTGLVLFLISDDPDRYEAYKLAPDAAGGGAAPAPEGLLLDATPDSARVSFRVRF